MKESLKSRVFNFINSTKTTGVNEESIFKKFNAESIKSILKEINLMLKCGEIFQKNDILFSSQNFDLIPAKITKSFQFSDANALIIPSIEGFTIQESAVTLLVRREKTMVRAGSPSGDSM